MAIIRDVGALDDYLLGVLPGLVPSEIKTRYPNDKTGQINMVLGKNPLLFDRYLTDAIEVDVDCLSRRRERRHRRHHGAYRGSRHSFRRFAPARCRHARCRRRRSTRWSGRRKNLAKALGVDRPDERAIRAQGRRDIRAGGQSARVAHRALRGQGHRQADRQDRRARHGWRAARVASTSPGGQLDHVGVKEAVFPFARFPGVDTVLGPEMRSTGEVIGLDRSFAVAFAKSQLGAGARAAHGRQGVRLGARRRQGAASSTPFGCCTSLGFHAQATGGTARFSTERGIPTQKINKVSEGRPHIVDAIKNGASNWCSTPPKGRRRWPTRVPCAARPSCIRFPITRPSRGRWPPPRGSKPICREISKCERCRTISRDPGECKLLIFIAEATSGFCPRRSLAGPSPCRRFR